MRVTIVLNLVYLMTCLSSLSGQGFSNWMTGDSSDFITTEFMAGTVLAGGGGDNDEAMMWMLNRAGGGDVLVLRASNSDGYNPYFFSELGVMVNSVETIRFDNATASASQYIARRIREAEVIFIAGGDQYDYYRYFKDNAIEEALDYAINDKKITIAGTSAGMAILGEAYYTPSGGSLDSQQALSNPFHPNVEILGKADFLSVPFMENTITDTHFEQRDRQGRSVTFMARLVGSSGERVYNIACNEYTAVCIDENGLARVFGEYPEYEDYGFFMSSNCMEPLGPEVLENGVPLTWNRSEEAVHVYRVPGILSGTNYLDLKDWKTGEGGQWENWYVKDGDLRIDGRATPGCGKIISSVDESNLSGVRVYPNPAEDFLFIEIPDSKTGTYTIKLYDSKAQLLEKRQVQNTVIQIDLSDKPQGVYLIEIRSTGRSHFTYRFIKN